MKEKEVTVWCPRCKVDKYDVYRIPTRSDGVYEHVTEPPNLSNYEAKYCLCGAALERKP